MMGVTRDVLGDLDPVGQANLGNFPHSGVRFLRRRSIDACAHAAFLRTSLQVLRLLALYFWLPRLADQLLDRWHSDVPVLPVSNSTRHMLFPTCTETATAFRLTKAAAVKFQRIETRAWIVTAKLWLCMKKTAAFPSGSAHIRGVAGCVNRRGEFSPLN